MAERTGAGATKPVVEEIHHRSEQVYVCLVVNRRHRSARIVDFLAGNFPQKQAAIQRIASREGIQRVYTLVEREESTGWAKVGYAREGSIPGYYKRSDAYVMGHLIHNPPRTNADGVLLAPVADVNKAEKALNAAKKLKEEISPRTVKTQMMSEQEIADLRASAKGKKGFAAIDDRFLRSGSRIHLAARDSKGAAKSGEQIVSAEVQECFGNAYVSPDRGVADERNGRARSCRRAEQSGRSIEGERSRERVCVHAGGRTAHQRRTALGRVPQDGPARAALDRGRQALRHDSVDA